MALIVCPDCKSQVSDQAPNCPKCGRVIKKPGQSAGGVLAAIIIGLIIAYVLFLR